MGNPADGHGGVRHAALLYRAPDEFAVDTGAFVDAGLRDGEAVLVAATSPRLHRVQARLGDRAEHVTWLDLSGIGGNPRRIMSMMRLFAEHHRDRPIRFAREAGWRSRPAEELHEALRYEVLFNRCDTPLQVLCAYDVSMGAAVLDCAKRTHPVVVRDGRWQPSASYAPGSQVPGECDYPLASPPADAATLTFRHDLARVREVVAGQARMAGLSQDRTADLVLAASELAANTYAHTGRPGRLTVWCAEDEIICQIQDSGHITDPLAGSLPPDVGTSEEGWGLWVVHQVCDLVQSRTGREGTTTRLHMRLRPPRRAWPPYGADGGGAREGHPVGA